MTVETEPSLAQLRALAAFVEHGSMTAAADQLGIKRSTLWAQLDRFADAIELKLSESVARDLVRPSPTAVRLSDPARRILVIVEELERIVAETSRGEIHGRITVAVYPAPVSRFVARAVREFRDTDKWRHIAVYFEGLDDRFRESGGDLLLTMLFDGDADVTIAPSTSRRRMQRVSEKPLYKAQLCAYDPNGLVVKAGEALQVTNLRSVQLLVAPRTSTSRRLLVELLREDGCFPQFFVESPSVEALQGLAEAGHGVAILPDDALPDDAVASGRVVPVASSSGGKQYIQYWTLRLNKPADPTLDAPVTALESILQERAKAYDCRVDARLGDKKAPRRRAVKK